MTDWNVLASEEQVQTVAAALEANGMRVIVAENGEEAKKAVFDVIPEGAEVMSMTSVTLDTLGITHDINETDRFDPVRPHLYSEESKWSPRERKQHANAPEWSIGSVHAITEKGQVVIASNTGSQLAAHVYGADHVVWVVGTQKLVSDLDAAFKRIYEHTLELESERARKAYGVAGSYVSKMVIVNKEVNKDRVTVILVKEVLGY